MLRQRRCRPVSFSGMDRIRGITQMATESDHALLEEADEACRGVNVIGAEVVARLCEPVDFLEGDNAGGDRRLVETENSHRITLRFFTILASQTWLTWRITDHRRFRCCSGGAWMSVNSHHVDQLTTKCDFAKVMVPAIILGTSYPRLATP